MIRGKINPRMKWGILLSLVLWAIIIAVILFSIPAKADDPTEEQRTINAAEVALQSTVIVEPDAYSHGTGFYIAENKVLTALHVVKGKSEVTITNKEKVKCTAKVEYREEGWDLAVLTTDCKGKPMSFANDVKVGQTVLGIGHPKDHYFLVTKGVIGNLKNGQILSDIKAETGISGGALINLQGEIVGLTTSRYRLDPYIIFSVDYNNIKRFLERSEWYGNPI